MRIKNLSSFLNRSALFAVFFWVLAAGALLYFTQEGRAASEGAPRGTNITVDSKDLEPISIDRKTDPDKKPVLYSEGDVSVGFNEDSEPNINRRF